MENIDNYSYVTIHKNNILFRGFDNDGKKVIIKTNEVQSSQYIKTTKNSDAVSILGDKLKKVDFEDMIELSAWKNKMKEHNIKIYNDINIDNQLMERLPKKNHVTLDMLTWIMYDIETTVNNINSIKTPQDAEEEFTLISSFDNKSNSIHLFAYQDYKDNGKYTSKYPIIKHLYKNEKELITGFIHYWDNLKPDIISGWNIDTFDNVFLFYRALKLLGSEFVKRLSPFGVIKCREAIGNFGKTYQTVDFVGVASLDYIELYKAFNKKPRPNYKLDTIAEIELKANKIKYKGSFKDFYENNWDDFVQYNIRDTELVVDLQSKFQFIDLCMELGYLCYVNYKESLSTVKKTEILLYSLLLQQGKILPPKTSHEKSTFEGAFVQDTEPNRYGTIVSYDVASLYPNVDMQFAISPENIVYDADDKINDLANYIKNHRDEYIAEKIDMSPLQGTNYCISPNGTIFDTSNIGVLPMFMSYLYNKRKASKKVAQEHKILSQELKKEIEKRGLKL